MPTYVQGTVVKSFYARYAATTGYWSYAGPIAISAPSLSTPGSTSTTEIGTTSARLNWGSVTAAESYRYQVTSATSFATTGDGSVCSNCIVNTTTTGTTQVITGLASSTTYRWRVRAGNATTGQGSPWSSTLTFTTAGTVVTSVTPTSATLGQLTTFTVAGTNLTAGMGFWIDECSGIMEVSGGSATSRQFRCTPSFSAGTKSGEVKTAPGGTLLRAFTVNVTVPLPTVTSVTPTSATLGQLTTFNLAGTNLTAGMGFWIDECSGITEVSGGSATSRQFRCTPSFSAGTKSGEVKTAPGGTLLRAFTVNVTSPLPTVTSVTPASATLGQLTTFNVAGTNLTAGMGFWIDECSGITEVSGGSATSRQFRCTPSFSAGTKSGEVKTAPGGTLLRAFTVNVTAPLPTVASVAPLNAVLGQVTTFTVAGTNLTAGMGFWIHDCAGVTEISGGTAESRQFRCTPGTSTGTKAGEVKTAPSGSLLHTFSVDVIPLPTVTEVKPINAIFGEPTVFTVYGSSLPAGMGFWVHDCTDISELSGGTATERLFRCTPDFTTGTKPGEVKTAPGGTLLRSFTVNAITRPTGISVAPLQATLNVPLTFTIDGIGLPAGMGFWVDDCAGVTEIAGGTSSRRQFRCTPGDNGGVKSGEVKAASAGTLLLAFSVNVTGPPPTVSSVTPLTAILGQETTFTVAGTNLTAGMGFWIHDCAGVAEIPGGSATGRQFRCTPSFSTGTKAGEVKTAPDGTLLRQFSVAVAGSGIYVNVDPWAQVAADFMVQHGIVVDPPGHDLRGTSDIRRAELATMLYRALGGGLAEADARFAAWHGGLLRSPFVDAADPTVWYYRPVAYLGNLTFGDGISVFDRTQGVFWPDGIISRAWVVKAILETWDIPPLTSFQGVTLFTDVPASHPAAGYIYRAVEKGIATGTDGVFAPDTAADRQDLFVLLHRLLDASANARSLAVPSPAPLTPADFDDARAFAPRTLGSRYEQPVLMGVQPPTAAINVIRSGLETVGTLQGLYTVTLEAVASGIDPRSFTDAGGISYHSSPFCSWEAASGGLMDETPVGGIPFSRVKWIAPSNSSPAGGGTFEALVTLRVGDGLGSEVTVVRTLALSGRPASDSSLPVLTIDPLPVVQAGEVVEVTGSIHDSGDSESPAFGNIEVYLSFSRNGGSSWTNAGRAALRADGRWDALWRVPEPAGPVVLRARAVNVRGNQRAAQVETTITPRLSIQGVVVNTSSQALPGAQVTLSEGGIDLATALADAQGAFLFTTGGAEGLATGRSYTLTAVVGAQRATASGIVLTSATPRAERTLTLGIDSTPPVTEASVPSGIFSTPFTVTLTCQDDSSGCTAIRYTMDGSVPTLASPIYASPISVAGETTLRFFGVDGAGNREVPRRRTYTFRPCSFEVAPASAAFAHEGGTGEVVVQTGDDCVWRLESAPSWITVSAGGDVRGSGSAGYAVAPNIGEAPRSGSLAVAGRTVAITQEGAQAPAFTLTVQTAGFGSGQVWSSPAGINCPADCSESFMAGTAVHLTAEAHPGSVFAGWSGASCAGTGPCTVTLNATRAVTAAFETEGTSCSAGWTSGGPLGGFLRVVVVDPSDSDHLYAAGVGGLFESHNRGESWSATSLGARSVPALVIDPVTPANLYAASWYNIFRSTNGGSTWVATPVAPGSSHVLALAIDPAVPSTLWAGTGFGFFKSADSGVSWSAIDLGVPNPVVTVVLVDPSNPQAVYAGTEENGIFQSTNGGHTWTTINNGLASLHITSIVRGPGSVLLASTLGGVYRSPDVGRTWDSKLTGGPAVLAQAPSEPSTFFAGTREGNIWRSFNNGDRWSLAGTITGAGQIQGLTVSPVDSATLYAATTNRGMFVSTDMGQTWQARSNGLASFGSTILSVEPENSDVTYTGNGNSGLFKTIDGGEQWTKLNVGLSQGALLDMVAASRTVLYAAVQDGVFKSTNSGLTWNYLIGSVAGKLVSDLAVSPADPETVYALAGARVQKSSNGGQSWQEIGTALGTTTRIEVHPGDPARILAQVVELGVGKLFRSVDGGALWTLVGNGLPVIDVNDLAFDPNLAGTIYAVVGSGIFKSADGGVSWAAVGTVPGIAYSLTVNPADSAVLYVGTWGSGVYRSADGGVSWSPWNEGLPAKEIFDLVASESSTVVVDAATPSRGVYRRIECPTASLSVTKSGTGTGRVTSVPAGIDCGADCTESVPEGTAVTFIAQPEAGSLFSGWSGAGCSGTGSCHVVAGGSTAITATFSSPCSFSISPAGQGFNPSGGTGTIGVSASPECAWSAASGQSWITISSGTGGVGDGIVMFTVAANPGPASRTGSLTIANQIFVIAQEGAAAEQFTLVVEVSSIFFDGFGTIVSEPGGIDCGGDCSESYAAETQVRLHAIPDPGSIFQGWSGSPDCIDGIVTLSTNLSCLAFFEAEPIAGVPSSGPKPFFIAPAQNHPDDLMYAVGRCLRIPDIDSRYWGSRFGEVGADILNL